MSRTNIFLTASVLCALWGGQSAAAEGTRTSKERLSDKASDEQRIDNCRVPVERRGPVPRPGCANGDVLRQGHERTRDPHPR